MRPLRIAFVTGMLLGGSIVSLSVLAMTAYVTASFPDVTTRQIVQYSRGSASDHPFFTKAEQDILEVLNKELVEEINAEHKAWQEKQAKSQP